MAEGDEILEHKLRKLIYNHVTTYPGVSFNTLKNLFEIRDSTLRYHLYILKKNKLIRSGVEKKIRCYYPKSSLVVLHQSKGPILKSHNLSPEQGHILNLIIHNPGIIQKDPE